MKYLILFVIVFLSSCRDRDMDDFKGNCPYELNFDGHFLKIPVSISPHKQSYRVGDTINIKTVFSDSIYDLGTQQTFKIESFPFKPHSLLYRFTGFNTYDSGYRVNELLIDSTYNHVYNYSSAYADGYRAYTIYEGKQYKFESKLILKEPGRYVLLVSDLYTEHRASGNQDLNTEADAITFEGKCPTLPYFLCYMIDSGDDHLNEFEEELIYLDKNVYKGHLRRNDGGDPLDPLYPGSLSLEFNGFFGFEVTE